MKNFKNIGFIILLVFIAAQFFSPKKNKGDIAELKTFYAETNPPKKVKIILENSCFDCHSNNTTYPWYNNITPVNYWLNHHVKDGKKHLDFTKWNNYSLKEKAHKMEELYEEIEHGEMPLKPYTWTHADAKLSTEQIQLVVSWGKSVEEFYEARLLVK